MYKLGDVVRVVRGDKDFGNGKIIQMHKDEYYVLFAPGEAFWCTASDFQPVKQLFEDHVIKLYQFLVDNCAEHLIEGESAVDCAIRLIKDAYVLDGDELVECDDDELFDEDDEYEECICIDEDERVGFILRMLAESGYNVSYDEVRTMLDADEYLIYRKCGL